MSKVQVGVEASTYITAFDEKLNSVQLAQQRFKAVVYRLSDEADQDATHESIKGLEELFVELQTEFSVLKAFVQGQPLEAETS